MLLSPAIRGMFGLRADALTHRLTMAPQLPAAWDGVTLHNVAVGDVRYDVTMHREGAAMMVSAASEEPTVLCLTAEVETAACTEPPARQHLLELPLPAIEVSLYDEPETYQGDQSHALHILDEQRGEHSLTLTVEAPADSTHTLKIRRNVASGAGMASLHVDGGDLQGDLLKLRTPAGKGYQTMKITLGW
jgi:hypothetical protein